MLEKISLRLIAFYQSSIKMLVPSCCRFSPSCSEYTKQAIQKYGFFKGGYKGLARLLHCHPFSGKSGYNPLV